ncbi:MAG: hypothetical protein U5K43_08175 [Halofilum sp. (in: g-proteobacteria)]|nr:hypothetical protein [Halofilum sp. (in: g-proteobacteria)]
MAYVRAYVAGFLATLVFHQLALGVLYLAGIVPVAPYATAPTPPFGVPSVISLAFWGGVWGLPLWPLIRRRRGPRYWLYAGLFGAVAPTAVALLVVFPLKGMAVSPGMIPVGAVLNATWGLGTAALALGLRRALPGTW